MASPRPQRPGTPPPAPEGAAGAGPVFPPDSSASAAGADANGAPTSRNVVSRGRFFGVKQSLIFVAMACAIIMIDLVAFLSIALVESSSEKASTESGSVSVARVADSLTQDATGAWTIDASTEDLLAQQQCWAALVSADGAVEWGYALPGDFPTTFTRNDIAVLAHDRSWGGSTLFIWTKNDDLVILGYPYGQYISWSMVASQDSFERVPFYIFIVFLIDLAIIFSLYALSQRSIVKSIGPTLDALDSLAQGRAVSVRFSGVLRTVGERINRVSDTLLRKDTARKNWVAGVSHDVRTPLAVSMGHAERIAADATLPQATRDSAQLIVSQGERIRDLVEDLNIATQLEYDMQPVRQETVTMARLLREVVADYLNQGLDRGAELELDIEPDAEQITLQGDARLLVRALRNAIGNALKHNAHDCTIVVSLTRAERTFDLAVADNGRGMAPGQLDKLVDTSSRDYLGAGSVVSRTPGEAALSADSALPSLADDAPTSGGPTPPAAGADDAAYPQGYQAPLISSQGDPYRSAPPAIRGARMPQPPQGYVRAAGTGGGILAAEGAAKRGGAVTGVAGEAAAPAKATSTAAEAAAAEPTNVDVAAMPETLPTEPTAPAGPEAVDQPVTAPDQSETSNDSAAPTQPATPVDSAAPSQSATPPRRSGTIDQHGLGLTLIARIVIVHGGTFIIQTSEGEGFRLIMRFPLSDAQR